MLCIYVETARNRGGTSLPPGKRIIDTLAKKGLTKFFARRGNYEIFLDRLGFFGARSLRLSASLPWRARASLTGRPPSETRPQMPGRASAPTALRPSSEVVSTPSRVDDVGMPRALARVALRLGQTPPDAWRLHALIVLIALISGLPRGGFPPRRRSDGRRRPAAPTPLALLRAPAADRGAPGGRDRPA